jgi:glucosyl-3-phosphoglycerate synthase
MMQTNGAVEKKMVVFDMDNTLLQGRFIDVCAQKFNFKQALTLLRQIDHDPVSLTIRIAGFLKGMKRSDLLQVGWGIQLVEGIEEVVSELKNRSYLVGIISDSYQLIAQDVAKRIGADFWMANELLYEGEFLTGKVLIPSYFCYSTESSCRHQVCKTNALRYITAKYNVGFENCIAVGDSDNDVCMINHAGMGVAYLTKSDLLRKAAHKHINQNSLNELLAYAS